MSEGTAELETLRTVLGEQARAQLGEHPKLESLVDYQRGALDEAAVERLRDHLAGCGECAQRLLELASLLRPEPAPADGVRDLEIEAAWREIQGRIGSAAEARGSDARRPGALALAASLAVVALALGLWAGRLHQVNSSLRLQVEELLAPVVNMPQLYLDGVTRSDQPAATLEVPAGTGHFGIFISVPDPVPAEVYEARFLDASGAVVLRVDGLVMSDSGSLRLGLARGSLPAGDYRLRVRGRSAGVWLPSTEYRMGLRFLARHEISPRTGESPVERPLEPRED